MGMAIEQDEPGLVAEFEDGRIVLMVGPPGDGAAIAFDAADAIETALRLLAVAQAGIPADLAMIDVDNFGVRPSPAPGAPATLELRVGDRVLRLRIEQRDLIGLSQAAAQALAAARPEGSG